MIMTDPGEEAAVNVSTVLLYLSQSISEGHGKEEVGISTSSMDPEVPENRTKDGWEKEHHHDNQSVAEIWDKEYTVQRNALLSLSILELPQIHLI